MKISHFREALLPKLSPHFKRLKHHKALDSGVFRGTKGQGLHFHFDLFIRGLRVTTLKPSQSLSPSHSPKNRSESESESLLSHVLNNAKSIFKLF